MSFAHLGQRALCIRVELMARTQSETEKKRSLKGFLFKAAVVFASVYLLFTFVSGQIQATARRRELDTLQTRVAQQAEENQELQRIMNENDQEAYTERMAREKLQYARPEERVYVDITGK